MDWLTDKQFITWKRRNAARRLIMRISEALAVTVLLMVGWYVLLVVFIDAIPA